MDYLAVIAPFCGAISVLFGAYLAVQTRRVKSLEEENETLKLENKDLDTENKEMQALILLAGEGASGVEELRREIARLLRRGR